MLDDKGTCVLTTCPLSMTVTQVEWPGVGLVTGSSWIHCPNDYATMPQFWWLYSVQCTLAVKLSWSWCCMLQVNDSQLRMLAVMHSLLVNQSLSGVFVDVCHWSVADLGFAVDQLQAVGCDLLSVDDATQILTHVYAARCHNKRDAEKIRAFIFRLITAWTTGSDDVNVQFIVSPDTKY